MFWVWKSSLKTLGRPSHNLRERQFYTKESLINFQENKENTFRNDLKLILLSSEYKWVRLHLWGIFHFATKRLSAIPTHISHVSAAEVSLNETRKSRVRLLHFPGAKLLNIALHSSFGIGLVLCAECVHSKWKTFVFVDMMASSFWLLMFFNVFFSVHEEFSNKVKLIFCVFKNYQHS